jgi:hypothetical protein
MPERAATLEVIGHIMFAPLLYSMYFVVPSVHAATFTTNALISAVNSAFLRLPRSTPFQPGQELARCQNLNPEGLLQPPQILVLGGNDLCPAGQSA